VDESVRVAALGVGQGSDVEDLGVGAESGGDAARRFADLGIELQDANGNLRPTNDLMLDAADALQRMGPGADQTATAMQLFGDKGRRLLPVLSQGRAGIQRMTDEFDQLGGALDGQTIDTMAEMTREIERAKQAVLGALMPAIRLIVDGFKKFVDRVRPAIDKLKDLAKNSHLVRAALITLGAVAAGLAAALIVAYAPVIAAFAVLLVSAVAIGLALDDVITTFEGGDSVIRRFIDGLYGVGTTTKVVDEFRDAWAGLTAIFDGVVQNADRIALAMGPAALVFKAMKDNVGWIVSKLPSLIELLTRLNPLAGVVTALGAVGRATGSQQRREHAALVASLPSTPSPLAPATGQGPLMAPVVAGSPTTAAIASGNGASSSRTVNTRAQVVIQGLVEDATIQRRIRDGIQEGLEASHAQALDTLDRTGDQ
jgi:phage-related protein